MSLGTSLMLLERRYKTSGLGSCATCTRSTVPEIVHRDAILFLWVSVPQNPECFK